MGLRRQEYRLEYAVLWLFSEDNRSLIVDDVQFPLHDFTGKESDYVILRATFKSIAFRLVERTIAGWEISDVLGIATPLQPGTFAGLLWLHADDQGLCPAFGFKFLIDANGCLTPVGEVRSMEFSKWWRQCHSH